MSSLPNGCSSRIASLALAIGAIPLDVYEDGNNLIAKASMPGVNPEEVTFEVFGDVLAVSDERKNEEEQEEKDSICTTALTVASSARWSCPPQSRPRRQRRSSRMAS
jgi:hypothetical protein